MLYIHKTQLRKRTESFVWRFAMAALVFGLEFLVVNATDLNIPMAITTILALAAGELSKYLNRHETVDISRIL